MAYLRHSVLLIFSREAKLLLNSSIPRVFEADFYRCKPKGIRQWPFSVSNQKRTSCLTCESHLPLYCAHTRLPQSTMQGAAPDSLHKTPLLEMVPTQHSSLPPGRPLQPVPPHVPHSAEQQTSPDCTPGSSLRQVTTSVKQLL